MRPEFFEKHDWQREDDVMLVRLVKAGDHSMAEIAELFARNGVNVSRNAVIGRVARLRDRGDLPASLSPRSRPRDAERAARPPKRAPVAPAERPSRADQDKTRGRPPDPAPPPRIAVPIAPLAIPAAPPVPSRPLGLFDPWPAKACRYPLFDKAINSDEPVFCGARSASPPYCEAHRLLIYPHAGAGRVGTARAGSPGSAKPKEK